MLGLTSETMLMLSSTLLFFHFVPLLKKAVPGGDKFFDFGIGGRRFLLTTRKAATQGTPQPAAV